MTIEQLTKLDIKVQLTYYNNGANRIPKEEIDGMTKKELIGLYYKLS